MDRLDFQEEREILSVLCDNNTLYFINGIKYTESDFDLLKTKILNAELLVPGQLVDVVSNYNSETYSIPGIITKVEIYSLGKYKYTIKQLTGNLDDNRNTLTEITITTDQLSDAIILGDDYLSLIDSITFSKLGYNNLQEMKVNLGIKHIYWLKDGKLKSHY